MLGDGSGHVFSTISSRLADHFTEICVKLGRSVTYHVEDNGCYRMSVTEFNQPQMGDNRKREIYIEKVPYEGKVYDLTVPNHLLYVRRNGKSCWSGNCYGTRQSLSNPYTGAMAIFASRLLNGKPPIIYEDGQQRRDFVHVSDVVRGIRLALESDVQDEVINIGSGSSHTILEMATLLMEAMELNVEPEITGQHRVGDIRHCFANISKAQRLLGYSAQMPIWTGMRELVEWLRTQTATDRVEQHKAELEERGLLV
jgi:hypothetical protein